MMKLNTIKIAFLSLLMCFVISIYAESQANVFKTGNVSKEKRAEWTQKYGEKNANLLASYASTFQSQTKEIDRLRKLKSLKSALEASDKTVPLLKSYKQLDSEFDAQGLSEVPEIKALMKEYGTQATIDFVMAVWVNSTEAMVKKEISDLLSDLPNFYSNKLRLEKKLQDKIKSDAKTILNNPICSIDVQGVAQFYAAMSGQIDHELEQAVLEYSKRSVEANKSNVTKPKENSSNKKVVSQSKTTETVKLSKSDPEPIYLDSIGGTKAKNSSKKHTSIWWILLFIGLIAWGVYSTIKSERVYKKYARGSEYVLVRQGISWPAFFFTFFWAFYKKAYKLGGIILITMVLGQYIVAFLVGSICGVAKVRPIDAASWIVLARSAFLFFISAALHYKGNKLVEQELVSSGFVEIKDSESINVNSTANITSVQKCPYCDNPLPANARHCPSCGADLSQAGK